VFVVVTTTGARYTTRMKNSNNLAWSWNISPVFNSSLKSDRHSVSYCSSDRSRDKVRMSTQHSRQTGEVIRDTEVLSHISRSTESMSVRVVKNDTQINSSSAPWLDASSSSKSYWLKECTISAIMISHCTCHRQGFDNTNKHNYPNFYLYDFTIWSSPASSIVSTSAARFPVHTVSCIVSWPSTLEALKATTLSTSIPYSGYVWLP